MPDHDYREFYEKDYLGAWNIPESGDLTVTIKQCVQGELNNPGTKKKTKKPVVYIQESEKGFALNATNGKTIAGLYGNKVSGWVGKRISLFKSMTRSPAGDGEVECMRVRPKVPAAGAQPKATEMKDDPASPTDESILADVDKLISARKFQTAADTASLIADEGKRDFTLERVARAYKEARA